MVRLEGNMSLNNPVTPPGIDPGTVRLVAQRNIENGIHKMYLLTCFMYTIPFVTIFTQRQDEVFSLNLAVKYVRLFSVHVWNAKPDCSQPNRAEPNKGMHRQTVM